MQKKLVRQTQNNIETHYSQ